VQVHRLLTVDSVDQRMLDILGTKTQLFDAYTRRSDLAEAAPEAVDISEQSLARRIVEEEQQRLAPGAGPSGGTDGPAADRSEGRSGSERHSGPAQDLLA